MSLQFYLGASGSGKSYQLHKDILKEADKNRNTNYLFIVPDQATMQTQLDLVEASENKGIMNVDVLSFGRLAHRVFEELGCNDSIVLDDTGKSLVLRTISGKLKDTMPTIGPNIDKIGYIHEIKSVISEFKQYDISPDKLDELISLSFTSGILNAKLNDLKKLYLAFNDYIRDEYITSEETLTLLSEKIYESNIIRNAVVVFDGFTGFTPVQYRLIKGLLELTDKVIFSITVDIDDNPYSMPKEQELFFLSKKTIRDIQLISQSVNVNQEADVILKNNYRHCNNLSLSHLQKHVFRYPIVPCESPNSAVEIFEADNPEDEVRNICIKIKELVLEQNYAYSDIAVVCAELDAYKYEFARFSKMYDIPFYLDETGKIGLNPFTECIKSALKVAKDNFSYPSVMHFIKSGLLDLDDESIDRFDNYVLKYGIRGRKKYTESFSALPSSTKGAETDIKDVEELNAINSTREYIVGLLEPILRKHENVGELIMGIYEFTIKGRMEDKIHEMENSFAESGMPEKAREYGQIYKLIMDLLDQIYSLLKSEKMSLDEFIGIFESGIDEIDVGTIPGSVDRVVVGDIERSRIGELRVLFFAGVNDGNIPKVNSKGGLISDVDREMLREANVELAMTPREQIFVQRFYLYLTMTKPSDRLYVSYSRLTGGGKSVKRSYLIGQLLKYFPNISVETNASSASEFVKICGVSDGTVILGNRLREYTEETLTGMSLDELATLYAVIDKKGAGTVSASKLFDTAFWKYKPTELPTELAQRIYGNEMSTSISRLEKFAACEYAHFLSYAMKLVPRDEFEFEARDLGSVFHEVFEQFGTAVTQKGYSLADFPDEVADSLILDIIENLSATYKNAILHASAQSAYMQRRIANTAKCTVTMLREQLRQGKFVPEAYEQGFKEKITEESDMDVELKGVIDRIDTCKDDDKLYVKVVDYKSSEKSIDLDKLLYGIQIQQPVYMKAAIDVLKKKYPGKDVKMGAMLYYHIDDPLVEVKDDTDDEEIFEARKKAMAMSGLVNDDADIYTKLDQNLCAASAKSSVIPVSLSKEGLPTKASKVISFDDYQTIEDYVGNLLIRNTQSIYKGRMAINPKNYEDRTSCKYCEYKEICPFDEKIEGFEMKELKKMSDEDAVSKMAEENANGD